MLICRGTKVLRAPSNAEVAECLGFNAGSPAPQSATWWWSARPGSRPRCTRPARGWTSWCWRPTPWRAGRARARRSRTTSASTGIWRRWRAGRSPRPRSSAPKAIASKAARLDCSGSPYAIELEGGHRIRARCVVIAGGAEYRSRIQGRPASSRQGVYGAMFLDKKVLEGEEVVVVGGATSPVRPQYLGRRAARAHAGAPGGLAESMSATSSAASRRARGSRLHPDGDRRTERERGAGRRAVAERRDRRDRGPPRPPPLLHDGGQPLHLLARGVRGPGRQGVREDGQDLTPEDPASTAWLLSRPPLLLEHSRPGIFAVGDVRSGNIKRGRSGRVRASSSWSTVPRPDRPRGSANGGPSTRRFWPGRALLVGAGCRTRGLTLLLATAALCSGWPGPGPVRDPGLRRHRRRAARAGIEIHLNHFFEGTTEPGPGRGADRAPHPPHLRAAPRPDTLVGDRAVPPTVLRPDWHWDSGWDQAADQVPLARRRRRLAVRAEHGAGPHLETLRGRRMGHRVPADHRRPVGSLVPSLNPIIGFPLAGDDAWKPDLSPPR